MGILKKIEGLLGIEPENSAEPMTYGDLERFFTSSSSGNVNALAEPTYFTCLKLLSESVGKLSIHLLDKNKEKVTNHDGVNVLSYQPNPFMTPSIFKQLMEFNRNHYGNAYAYIKTNRRGKCEGLYPLDPRYVKIYLDNADTLHGKGVYFYEYTNPKTRKVQYFSNDEILHFKGGTTLDGLVGKSVREVLASTISSGTASQQYLNDLYKAGMTANCVVKFTGDLDPTRKTAIKSELARQIADNEMGRVMVLPMGFDIQPLNLKLTDSQFAELKKFNALQIAAAFGVKPNHLNDFERSSYANSEMQNLSFYVDTLLYILKAYEEELNIKLLSEAERNKGYEWRFNVATILRGDLKSQAEALTRYVAGSVYTVNEARSKAGLPPIEGGDVIMCNGSYVPIEDIGKAYGKGGE